MINKFRELFKYKGLIYNLTARELKIKYKRSILGFFWSFMNPILLMAVYTIVFSLFLKVAPPVGANGLKSFPAFLLVGLLAWNYFGDSMNASVVSLVDAGNLFKKTYFPREIIPFSAVLANLFNYSMGLIVLYVVFLILGNNFLILIPFLLFIVLIETFLALGLSLLLSVSHVYYRDTKHLLSVALTLLFFAAPIVYPFNLVANVARSKGMPWLITLYKLNPMASLIMIYQKIMYSLELPSWQILLYVFAVSVSVFFFGYFVFSRAEPHLAEEV